MLRRGGLSTARRRKAPVALLSFRSVLLAVCVAALLGALTAAASPFVTTAAGSEALANRLTELSPYATGLQITGPLPDVGSETNARLLADEARREAAAKRLAASLPGVGAPVLTSESGIVYAHGSDGDNPVRLMARTGALDHVAILSRTSGPGVYIASITAELGHLKPGDTLRIDGSGFGGRGTLRLRIKGVYRALSHSPETAYWSNLYQDIYPMTPDDPPPPSYVLLGARQFLLALKAAGVGPFRLAPGAVGAPPVESMVELPVDPKALTLAGARALERRFSAVGEELRRSPSSQVLGCCTTTTSLESAVLLADRNIAAVKVPISLLADAGTAIALGVAAAAGAFLVRRRRGEAALAYARGEHVASFAGRTAVEALVPALAGGATGYGIALGVTGLLAPAGSTDTATMRAAAVRAAVAVAVALAFLVATASVGFLRLFDTGSRPLPWLRWVPWELPLLGVAVYLLVQIRSGHGLSGDASNGAAHPTLAVFVFPLLLVGSVAGLATRGVRLGLRLGARLAGRSPVPVYLALRRLAAARGLLVMLAVVTASALGAFAYAESLAASLHRTTIEKAYIATGSDAQVSVVPDQPLPRRFPYPITRVAFSNQSATLDSADGVSADVMLVDPATVGEALHWEGDWGANPAGLLRRLATAPSRPLPVIVTSDAAHVRTLVISGIRFPVRVLGAVKAFPLMAAGIPLVVTSYRALQAESARVGLANPLGELQSYVWGKGPPAAVERALMAAPVLEPYYPSSIATFLHDPNVLLATRTYAFMRTVAVAALVLVLLGLLLYLQARQRSQVIASALARRMGLDARGEALSVGVEALGILVFAALIGGGIAVAAAGPVVRHIDPLPQDAPSPIFSVPLAALLVASAGLVVAAALAGALTAWLASRADVNRELRVA